MSMQTVPQDQPTPCPDRYVILSMISIDRLMYAHVPCQKAASVWCPNLTKKTSALNIPHSHLCSGADLGPWGGPLYEKGVVKILEAPIAT